MLLECSPNEVIVHVPMDVRILRLELVLSKLNERCQNEQRPEHDGYRTQKHRNLVYRQR